MALGVFLGAFLFVFFTAFFSISAEAARKAGDCPPRHSAWLTDYDGTSLATDVGASETIDDMAKRGFNEVNPIVYHNGNRFFTQGSLAQSYPNGFVFKPGFDPLQAYVDKGHAKGMRVMPLLEDGLKVFKDNELTNKPGATITSPTSPHKRYLNPFNPEVQDYLTKLMTDIAGNYDVDGLQLDDNFSLPEKAGNDDPYVRAQYQEYLNKATKPVLSPYQWRTRRMTEIVHQIMQKTRAAAKARGNKNFKLVLASHSPGYAKNHYTQDSEAMIRNGDFDEFVVQDYRKNATDFGNVLNDRTVVAVSKMVPVRVAIAPDALEDRKASIALVREQMKKLKSAVAQGRICPGVAWWTKNKLDSAVPGNEFPADLTTPFPGAAQNAQVPIQRPAAKAPVQQQQSPEREQESVETPASPPEAPAVTTQHAPAAEPVAPPTPQAPPKQAQTKPQSQSQQKQAPASADSLASLVEGTYEGHNGRESCTVVISRRGKYGSTDDQSLTRILMYNKNAVGPANKNGKQVFLRDEFAELTVLPESLRNAGAKSPPAAGRMSMLKSVKLSQQVKVTPSAGKGFALSVNEPYYKFATPGAHWVDDGRIVREIKKGSFKRPKDTVRLTPKVSELEASYGPDRKLKLTLAVSDQGVSTGQKMQCEGLTRSGESGGRREEAPAFAETPDDPAPNQQH